MEIRRYVSDLLESNMYLLVEQGHALVIDPCRDTAPAAGLTVDRLILTHEHYDHISGVNDWKALTGAPVLCSEACAEAIRSPRMNLARIFEDFCALQTWVKLDAMPPSDPDYACEADETFADRLDLSWRGHKLALFALPGHSMGGIGILLDDQSFFSGDSLLENDRIELRLPGGSKRAWREIGEPRLNALPRGLTVYPGHFQAFRLQ